MTAAPRKRPFYLVLALLAAVVCGAYGALQGWSAFLLYRGGIDPALVGQDLATAHDRAAIAARAAALETALDAAKAWGWPIAVAAIVLGSAMFVFAMRSLAGSGAARTMLVQIVIVQAGLNMAQHWLLRGVEEANLGLSESVYTAYLRESVPERNHPEARAAASAAMWRTAYPFSLAAQALGSALIVLALTRRRAREFFDASAEALGER
jgi:hypothetical protein